LCNGLGPALFGFIFYLFHVDLNETTDPDSAVISHDNNTYHKIQSAIRVSLQCLFLLVIWTNIRDFSSVTFYQCKRNEKMAILSIKKSFIYHGLYSSSYGISHGCCLI
jgi:hypothetical protein